MMPGPQSVENAFLKVLEAALKGERCPPCHKVGEQPAILRKDAMTQLYRSGRVRAEIYAKNYRVITILTGPHRGKTTAPAPRLAKPWLVIDAKGARKVA